MAKGYLTDAQYAQSLTIPFGLPETRLLAGHSLIVASLRVNLGQVARVKVLNFHVLRVLSTLTQEVTTNVTSNDGTSFSYQLHQQVPTTAFLLSNQKLGLGYAGIFSSDFTNVKEPTGTPLCYAAAPDTGIYVLSPYNRYDFSSPDVYHVVVVNNTNHLDLDVCVTGAFSVKDIIQSNYENTLDTSTNTTAVSTTNSACVCCNLSGASQAANSYPNLTATPSTIPYTIPPIGGITIYESNAQTATCPNGYTGNSVSVPYGYITSTISQSDADSQALAVAMSYLVCTATNNGSGTGGTNNNGNPTIDFTNYASGSTGDACGN
jgi:hypothetical protein